MQKYLHIFKIHVKTMNEGELLVFHHGNEASLHEQTLYIITKKKMRFIQNLSFETLSLLNRLQKESKYNQVRQRALCIRLSFERYKIKELMTIFKVSRSTIYNWFNNWEEEGLRGLYDYKGRGRKKLFNREQQQQIKEWTKEEPKQLNLVRNRAEKEWGITASKDTIKRVLKSANFRWHRIRKVLGGKPNGN